MNYHHMIIFQLLLFHSLLLCVSSNSTNKMDYCKIEGVDCVVMKNSKCLGVQLPYTSTTTDLVTDVYTPEEALVCYYFRIYVIKTVGPVFEMENLMNLNSKKN